MSIFYGVRIRDKDLSFYFDAIRFLFQPDALRHSHITVRGPYERRIDLSKFDHAKLGALCIVSPGHFFLNRQNTVFLYCEIVGIRDIWNKPSFKDGVVHMTLYDGNNRQNAQRIFDLLLKYRWPIWTNPTNLLEIEKKTISNESINILEQDFTRRFLDLFDNNLDISNVKKYNFDHRMEMAKFILDRIERRYIVPLIARKGTIVSNRRP